MKTGLANWFRGHGDSQIMPFPDPGEGHLAVSFKDSNTALRTVALVAFDLGLKFRGDEAGLRMVLDELAELNLEFASGLWVLT